MAYTVTKPVSAETDWALGAQASVSTVSFPVALLQDFVARLQAALTARGLEYDVATTNQNFAFDLTPILGYWSD